MAQRLRLGPGAGSPFLVSVAGVNAGAANYLQLVFNGNTPPLRIWQTGYVTATQPATSALPLPYPVVGPGGFTAPGGAYPLFLIMGRPSATSNVLTPYRNVGQSGGFGGMMSSAGNFVALQMDQSPSAPATTYVNFCILRNYG